MLRLLPEIMPFCFLSLWFIQVRVCSVLSKHEVSCVLTADQTFTPELKTCAASWCDLQEALDDLLWKDETGPSSIRRTLELFQRQRWGNVWETRWSAYGLFRAHIYHLQLNWTELTLDVWNQSVVRWCWFSFFHLTPTVHTTAWRFQGQIRGNQLKSVASCPLTSAVGLLVLRLWSDWFCGLTWQRVYIYIWDEFLMCIC